MKVWIAAIAAVVFIVAISMILGALISFVTPFWLMFPLSLTIGAVLGDVLAASTLPWLVKRSQERRKGEA